MSCCPGPVVSVLSWTPCGSEELLEVSGWVGGDEAATAQQEACTVHAAIWTTNCWQEQSLPEVGEVIDLDDGYSWHVRKRQTAGCLPSEEEITEAEAFGLTTTGLTVVLELARAALPCPDCEATIYSPQQAQQAGQDCEFDSEPIEVADEVPITVCPLEDVIENFGDAERVSKRVLICIGGGVQVEPEMLITCESVQYRVVSVRQRCDGTCLTTVEAEVDTFAVLGD